MSGFVRDMLSRNEAAQPFMRVFNSGAELGRRLKFQESYSLGSYRVVPLRELEQISVVHLVHCEVIT